MKQFLKFTLATIVGVIIASFLGMLILFGIFGALASSKDSVTTLKPNSVYEIKLKGQLIDRSEDDPFSAAFAEAMGQNVTEKVGLDDLLSNIKKAKNDANISGIYLNGGTLSGGYASLKELRDALVDFKASGKFIIAYADVYTQKNYYVVSVADKILLNPMGMVEFQGIGTENMFVKNTLEKLGIEMQVVKVGTFKSGPEFYTNSKMSDFNREQVSVYINSIWNTLLQELSVARNMSVEQLNAYADELLTLQPAEKLKEMAIVDTLVYANEVDSIIKQTMNLTGGDKYRLVKHSAMNKLPDNSKFQKDKVAIIYAVGAIDDTSSDGISSEKLVKTINEVAKDDAVKSVVFRVSSPGGSAYGSEQIWNALVNLKAKKPLIVSMGDYAASGGYYISCMADTIVAQPNTITGSIGIYGLIPNISGLNSKLGLTYDGVKTNKMSDAISVNRPFKPEERAMMQTYINRGYEIFVKRCADGRGKTTDEIKAIAEGRVWTGEDALEIGLVDLLGGLDDAVAIAVEKAGLTAYNIKEFPEKEDFRTKLMKGLSTDLETRLLKSQLGEKYNLFMQVTTAEKMNGIFARLPLDFELK